MFFWMVFFLVLLILCILVAAIYTGAIITQIVDREAKIIGISIFLFYIIILCGLAHTFYMVIF